MRVTTYIHRTVDTEPIWTRVNDGVLSAVVLTAYSIFMYLLLR